MELIPSAAVADTAAFIAVCLPPMWPTAIPIWGYCWYSLLRCGRRRTK